MEKKLKAAWGGKCSWTETDQGLGCVMHQEVQPWPRKARGHYEGDNWIPISAFEYVTGTLEPEQKRASRS